jgi:hypothetical protein
MKPSGSLSDIAGSVKGYLKKKQQRQSLASELSQVRQPCTLRPRAEPTQRWLRLTPRACARRPPAVRAVGAARVRRARVGIQQLRLPVRCVRRAFVCAVERPWAWRRVAHAAAACADLERRVHAAAPGASRRHVGCAWRDRGAVHAARGCERALVAGGARGWGHDGVFRARAGSASKRVRSLLRALRHHRHARHRRAGAPAAAAPDVRDAGALRTEAGRAAAAASGRATCAARCAPRQAR